MERCAHLLLLLLLLLLVRLCRPGKRTAAGPETLAPSPARGCSPGGRLLSSRRSSPRHHHHHHHHHHQLQLQLQQCCRCAFHRTRALSCLPLLLCRSPPLPCAAAGRQRRPRGWVRAWRCLQRRRSYRRRPCRRRRASHLPPGQQPLPRARRRAPFAGMPPSPPRTARRTAPGTARWRVRSDQQRCHHAVVPPPEKAEEEKGRLQHQRQR